jgi:PAS domain S-box-containing protein
VVTSGKPGIFVRLSNIIVVQVLFIFAALALVLLYPTGQVRSGMFSVEYAVLVLFLASTLISLLTVYWLSKRFREPLDRLIRGIEKTSEGELYYSIEADSDEEMDRLTGAFNRMTQRLWDNQKELKRINSQLKESNESIKESQVFLAALIDNSPLSIVVTNPQNAVLIYNRAAAEVFAFSRDEVIGRSAEMLFAEMPANILPAEDDPPGREAICLRKGGEHFPAYVAACRVVAEGGRLDARLYIIRDISESQSFQDMMIRLDRYYTRGEMAGDIAHEINNYLAVLMGNLELLPIFLRKAETEKIDKKLEVMKTTVDRIARFANGLMDTPHDEAKFETASVNQLVENIIAFLKPQNRFDSISIGTELSTDITLLDLDPGQIQQLLVNLIYNASEVLLQQEGEKRVTVRTSRVTADGRNWAQVEVKDNGPGVPAAKEADLFKTRFTTKRKGHGIGLITCRKIVENHGGEIGYRFDNGAVFYFRIPVERRVQSEVQIEGEPAQQESPTLSHV